MAADSRSQKIINALEKLEANQGDHVFSRRSFQRVVLRGDAHLLPNCRVHTNPNPMEIKYRDISRGGLGFITTHKLESGSDWRVILFHNGYAVCKQGLIIRHQQEVQDGLYLTGGQFVIHSGLLSILGVDPTGLDFGDAEYIESQGDFQPE
ncbi:hypothetical protein [Mucisphaera sp.]|uniref:hypothetical protein n=1 Tax=Mucisphaera sp. TaxID=2913024 RepID=UPI003D13B1EE